ncbi:methyltransferase domain-containing protein [Goodfellowiella coeruleoviolacea]|uniref:Protein-L-isoaspartate O-methyltransferase n=1 Tax=Goodfellowiella coeruleoviolacea TaxID=334858 RepID=A0AAE3KPG0_9PSEU|nr:methyltransferase domain-containing protein [Goodfellowiella coeruleoviolacea]MCP2169808.1 protein-L-isoaspartate(D-aspartate) O-methyltransferase [Goodfellowiella coeruleoviolacea]
MPSQDVPSQDVAATDWSGEFASAARAAFVPEVIWVGGDHGYVSLCRATEPEAWLARVAADEPVVTQVDDGRTPPGQLGRFASSSCSQPSLVADMLVAADIRPGVRVLEIGTGTGWNCALLCARVGSERVVSVEIDAALAAVARRSLRRLGYAPTVVVGDGALGHPPAAPYDRVLATCSVGVVPHAWVEQTRPGGVVVTPWGTDFCNGALARLVVDAHHRAVGRFGGDLAFMRLRAQRRPACRLPSVDVSGAAAGTTALTCQEIYQVVTFRGSFAIGLRVPRCRYWVEDDPDNEYRHTVWLHDARSRSWARLLVAPGEPHHRLVHQHGPRRLWTEVEAAHRWWVAAGRPDPTRFGLTVTSTGQVVWLDDPDHPVPPLS